MTYHNVAIFLKEAKSFDEGSFLVENKGGLVFKAESVYGKSFGTTPDQALGGAKKQIDQAFK